MKSYTNNNRSNTKSKNNSSKNIFPSKETVPKRYTRLYLEDYPPSKLTANILNKLHQYLDSSVSTTRIFSHDGIFELKSDNVLYKLIPNDKPIRHIQYPYTPKDSIINIIADESDWTTTNVESQVPFNHVVDHVYELVFCFSNTVKSSSSNHKNKKVDISIKPLLQFVVEGVYISKPELNSYTNFVPTHFYFRYNNDIIIMDYENIQCKIYEFFSILF